MKQQLSFAGRCMTPVILFMVLVTGCKKDTQQDRYEQLKKNIPENFRAFVNPFNDGSTIGAVVNLAFGIVILYNEPGTKYAWYQHKKIQGIFSVKDPMGPLGASIMDSIGAAFESTPGNDYLRIFARDGKTYQLFEYTKSQFGPADSVMPAGKVVGKYVDYNGDGKTDKNDLLSITNAGNILSKGPFTATGFEAAVRYVKTFQDDEIFHVFEKGGTRYARWNSATHEWGPVTDFTAWGGNNNLFPSVRAAAYVIINPGYIYNIFISIDGSQMGAWRQDGNTSVFEGPWKIN